MTLPPPLLGPPPPWIVEGLIVRLDGDSPRVRHLSEGRLVALRPYKDRLFRPVHGGSGPPRFALARVVRTCPEQPPYVSRPRTVDGLPELHSFAVTYRLESTGVEFTRLHLSECSRVLTVRVVDPARQ